MIKTRVDFDSRALLKEAESIRKVASERVRASVLADLQRDTPVDTGKARDSWEASPVDAIGGFTVQNLVDYIKYLNLGHSQQAPSYFIDGIALRYGKALGAIVKYF